MKSRYRPDIYITCPYYIGEDQKEIKCNGICGASTINVFKTKAAKEDYKDDFCKALFQNCPCYISLDLDGK